MNGSMLCVDPLPWFDCDMDTRACNEHDLVALRNAWPTADDVHGAHYTEQREGTATYLVAWQDEEPLGSGLIQWHGPIGMNARAAFPDSVEVNHLQVRPELRGRGVGTVLLKAAEQLAENRGYKLIAVGVALDNPDATRLYRRLGYTPTGVIDVCAYDWTDDDGQQHHEIETDQLLIKRLSP
ncbi:GNAT family N-acetyltransferase [Jatrophihabitans lederbergiae]|uniref:GNAT family N-acetyltransferase n=1 Tax=Jatrophihabitans lederbergiae TaxID=3075547 RepID=A0ABU2JAL5_9ACTN|nr:GNAT family N-acetyltransferase [Jatrophihabitans sp. DSM 44399]MDT0262025.1 GNAT family N-acetyltransferase [Jatrophihabitans sp. DSM 44399]